MSSESQRYTVGPAVELRLPLNLAVEFDALYRPFGYTLEFNTCCSFNTTRERAHSWEFPLIAKYRFSKAGLHPFLGVGYDPRIVHGTDYTSGSIEVNLGQSQQPFAGQTSTAYSATHGLVISAGIDLGPRRLKISPEIRYVHWSQPFLNQFGPDGSFRIQSAQNELFAMVGIMWR